MFVIGNVFEDFNCWQHWYNTTGSDEFVTFSLLIPTTVLPLIGLCFLTLSIPVGLLMKLFNNSDKNSSIRGSGGGYFKLRFTIQCAAFMNLFFYTSLFGLFWFVTKFRDLAETPPISVYFDFFVEAFTCLLLAIQISITQKFGIRSCAICISYFLFRCSYLLFEIILVIFIMKNKSDHETIPFSFSIMFNIILPLNFVISLFNLIAFLKLSPRSPEQQSALNENVLSFKNITFQSKLLFEWFTKFVFQAWRGHLKSNHLPDLEVPFTALPTTQVFAREMTELRSNKNGEEPPRNIGYWDLYKVMIVKTFGWYMLKTGCLRLLGDTIQFSSPVLLSFLIDYVENLETPQWQGLILCLVLFLSLGLECVIKLQYQNCMHQNGLMMKAAITNYTYQKAVKITGGKSVASVNIVNVLRLDCECFGHLNKQIHLLWSNPLTVSICIYLLYTQLKMAAFVSLVIVLVIIAMNIIILFLIQNQMKISRAIQDEKVNLVNEVISSIKQIKFYLLENAFHINIKEARKRELFAYNKTQIFLLIVHASLELSPTIIGVGSIFGYFLMYPNNWLTAGQLFVSLSVLNVLKVPLYSVSEVITSIQQSNILCQRLANFLNLPEINRHIYINQGDSPYDIQVENCTFKYFDDLVKPAKKLNSKNDIRSRNQTSATLNGKKSSEQNGTGNNHVAIDLGKTSTMTSEDAIGAAEATESNVDEEPKTLTKQKSFHLENINLSIMKGKLVAVIGPVKSGKSSLLSAIGGELAISCETTLDTEMGRPHVGGRLKRKDLSWDLQRFTFCPTTVQQNIILNDVDDVIDDATWERYKSILYCCGIFPDIPTLTDGDQTVLRDVSNVSGGQLKRISLARTAFFPASIYMFDDPLAHMDALSSKHIFDNLLSNQGILKDKTRIVVTNDLRFLDQFEEVIFMENGKIICNGSYNYVSGQCEETFKTICKQTSLNDPQTNDRGRLSRVWREQLNRYFDQPSDIEHTNADGHRELRYKSRKLLLLKLKEQRDQIRFLTKQNKLDRRSSEQLEEQIIRRISLSEKSGSALIRKNSSATNMSKPLSASKLALSKSPSTKSMNKFDFSSIKDISAENSPTPARAATSATANASKFQSKRKGSIPQSPFIQPIHQEEDEDEFIFIEARTTEESLCCRVNPIALVEEEEYSEKEEDSPTTTSSVNQYFGRRQKSHCPSGLGSSSNGGKVVRKESRSGYELMELVAVRDANENMEDDVIDDLFDDISDSDDTADMTHSGEKEHVDKSGKGVETEGGKRMSKNWLKSVSKWLQGAGVVMFSLWQLSAIGYVVMDVSAAIKLKDWAIADATMTHEIQSIFEGNNNGSDRNSSSGYNQNIHDQNVKYFSQYCAIKFGNVLMICARSLIQILCCYNASMYFNEKIVQAMLGCDLGEFQKLKRETILQRFTADMMRVDVFGFKVFFSLSSFYQLAALSIVIIYNIPSFSIMICFIVIIFVMIERLYARVRKQLIRIKQEQTEVALFGLYERTTSALVQIRTFGKEPECCTMQRKRVEDDLKVGFYILTAQKWLICRLYTLGNCLITATAVYCVLHRDGAEDVGLMGIVMNMALQMNSALYAFILLLGEVESETARVEHLREFMRLKQEVGGYSHGFSDDDRKKKNSLLTNSWPIMGIITIRNLRASYDPTITTTTPTTFDTEKNEKQQQQQEEQNETSYVLNNINLDVKSKEKVAIVGRSNSGKSSLVLALSRLIYTDEKSKIYIDGIDITTIPLLRLRQSLTIIPQNVMLFKDTLEYNLDPMQKHGREEMLSMLNKLGICQWPELKDKKDEELWQFECEKFRSEGQKQLIGIARGLLQKSKIVILDECTSQLDAETEENVEKVLEDELRDCTVLKIAHRINTVIDYDKVIVMQYGEVEEFGKPRQLLKQTNSLFYELWLASSMSSSSNNE